MASWYICTYLAYIHVQVDTLGLTYKYYLPGTRVYWGLHSLTGLGT
jgi:hypothetical protein